MRILIAGGGTGGHIYPALAIAKACQRVRGGDLTIEFAGTKAGLESTLVPREGYSLNFISIGKMNQVGWVEKLKTLLKLPLAIFESVALLVRFRPNVVVGVGGYASFPVVLMAALLRHPTVIWEPNAIPGMANRILARFVRRCLVVFAEAKERLAGADTIRVAMPIRKELEGVPTQKKSTAVGDVFHILVFGGSQGARALNLALSAALTENRDWYRGIKIVHQTGRWDYAKIEETYRGHRELDGIVEVREYLHDMPLRYQQADLVISRSGTGTISELAACGKPALLVPFPAAADNHQQKNAEVLVSAGAARMLLQKDLTPSRLIADIQELRSNPEVLREMGARAHGFHEPHADEKIAKLIMEIPR